MKGEILSIETAQELTENEKKIERLTRDKNLLELENRRLKTLGSSSDKELNYLRERNRILELIETYLSARRLKLEECNDRRYDIAILELKKLEDAIKVEKEMLANEECIDDRPRNSRKR